MSVNFRDLCLIILILNPIYCEKSVEFPSTKEKGRSNGESRAGKFLGLLGFLAGLEYADSFTQNRRFTNVIKFNSGNKSIHLKLTKKDPIQIFINENAGPYIPSWESTIEPRPSAESTFIFPHKDEEIQPIEPDSVESKPSPEKGDKPETVVPDQPDEAEEEQTKSLVVRKKLRRAREAPVIKSENQNKVKPVTESSEDDSPPTTTRTSTEGYYYHGVSNPVVNLIELTTEINGQYLPNKEPTIFKPSQPDDPKCISYNFVPSYFYNQI